MTETEFNLREALAQDSQANRRYLWLAQAADVEGHPEAGLLFRSLADARTFHAFGHLDHLEALDQGPPSTEAALRDEITTLDRNGQVAGVWADDARHEGQPEIAEWFETLVRAYKTQADRMREALEHLQR